MAASEWQHSRPVIMTSARGISRRGQSQLAQRITVAARAVEMIHPQRDRVFDQGDGLFIGDKAEAVAKAIRAKWE